MFFESFVDELDKIARERSLKKTALDVSMDPKKMILLKQFHDVNKGVVAQMKQSKPPKEKAPKEPSVIYHVKVKPQ